MRFVCTVLFVLISVPFANAAEKLPRVPEGFTIERITTPELVKHPMMAGFDDRGRLFVACSAGKNLRSGDLMKAPPNFIKMLEDTNGDGKFDKATVFADKMTLPMGALWYRGALYVASPPHIWKLEDTNGDGVADKRTILVDKFGFNGNAASVHGCFLGPTGRIYWCDGRHGHEFVDKKGNVVSKGKAARIFSCNPDGSDVRTHCGGGMDNPVEIDFTETGEMIGSVNILLSKPRVDCLVHWVEGGVYPRYDQQHCLDEFKRTGDPLTPMTKLGHVAVSGMMRYRSGAFGKTYANNIFTTQFNTHKVIRSVLKRSGATFTTTEHEFLHSDDPDFHPTDVLEDADGSLLVIDTGGWFRIGCPVSKVAKPHIHGAIYRIRKNGAHEKMTFEGANRLLRFGGKLRRSLTMLDHKNPFVRDGAIELFARSGKEAIPLLESVIKNEVQPSSTTKRRNAVWALSRINEGNTHRSIAKALNDPSESVRLAAAHAIDVRNLEAAAKSDVLLRLREMAIKDTPAVRREAARALGRNFDGLKFERGIYEAAVYGIKESLAKPGIDRVLEHSLILALIRFDKPQLTTPLLKHQSPAVRRAALIALDQMRDGNLTRELVIPLLDTDDPALQTTALAIIGKHDGWAKETLSLVRKWMTADGKLTPERTAMLRGFLVAQSADKNVQELVAEVLNSTKTDDAKRLLLLEVMQRSSVEEFPKSWSSAVKSAVLSRNADVALQAVRLAGERQLPLNLTLNVMAAFETKRVELRAELIVAVSPRLKQLDTPMLRWLTTELRKDHAPLVRLAIGRALAGAPWNDEQLVELTKAFSTADPLTAPVLLRAFERSKSETVGLALVKSLSGAKSAKSFSAGELNGLLQKYPRSVQQQAAPLLKSLGVNPAEQQKRIAELLALADGGDAERGREIFYSRKAACSGCHTVAGKGGRVGPDLSQIGKIRQPRDLVEAIAFPSASLSRGFRTYTVVTDRGRIHTGLISRETSHEIVLRTAELAEIRIPRKSVDIIRESPTSIMPKGLDKTLAPAELRDLLAWLRSRGKPVTEGRTGSTEKRPDIDGLLAAGRYSEIPRGKNPHERAAWALASFHLAPSRETVKAAQFAHEKGDLLGTYVLLQCHQNGVWIRRDRSEATRLNYALRTALERIEKPSPFEIFMLSRCGPGDKDGLTIRKDPKKLSEAINKHRRRQTELLLKAARLDVAQACQAMGAAQDDPAEAFKWYDRAGKLGLAEGLRYAGLFLTYGNGVERDLKKGRELSIQAANKGDVYAMINLGMFCFRGIGTKKNDAEANRWIERAANSGHWHGKLEKGMALLVGGFYGYKQDRKAGLKLWQQAVDSGNGEALFFVANACAKGFGLEKNGKLAVQFAEAAYRQGNSSAASILASIYANGLGNVEADKGRAMFWSRESIQRGFGIQLTAKDSVEKFLKHIDGIDPFKLKVAP